MPDFTRPPSTPSTAAALTDHSSKPIRDNGTSLTGCSQGNQAGSSEQKGRLEKNPLQIIVSWNQHQADQSVHFHWHFFPVSKPRSASASLLEVSSPSSTLHIDENKSTPKSGLKVSFAGTPRGLRDGICLDQRLEPG